MIPRPLRVLLVAQTPPPYGGQAVMMQRLLDGRYENVTIHHVRMVFSRQMTDIGRPGLRKVIHLFYLILAVTFARLRFRASTLYYPPSGPNRLPMYRDLVLLLCTRWMFRRTIFHFQAGGLSELYPTLSPWMRRLFRIAFFEPDVGIRTDRLAPEDPARLKAAKEVIIPNALEDVVRDVIRGPSQGSPNGASPPTILFVGVVRESKGVLILLQACGALRKQGLSFRLRLMGEFESHKFEAQVRELALANDLTVEYLGVRTGSEKHLVYAQADIFCFPSFFESEAFPVVLLEAMQFGLPIVGTRWRGIPAIVTDGLNGFLVPVRDSLAVADRVSRLLLDRELARNMGAHGRRLYEERYTLAGFHRNIQMVFDLVRQGIDA